MLIDRGFDANAFLADLAATGAQFLVRLKSTPRPALLRILTDGTYLARLGRLTVRIIEADLAVRLADGTTVSGRHRVATTLLDPATDPAELLTRLYAERWRSNPAISRSARRSWQAASCARATASAPNKSCGPPSPSTNCCGWP